MVYENRIYSRAEMRRLDIFTDEYALMRDEGEVTGTLVLKADARNGMVRLFFALSDGKKVITPVFWWQRAKGFFSSCPIYFLFRAKKEAEAPPIVSLRKIF